jgi:hypothetical protein
MPLVRLVLLEVCVDPSDAQTFRRGTQPGRMLRAVTGNGPLSRLFASHAARQRKSTQDTTG